MALNIRNYSLLCNQGTAKFNEDVVGINPFGAWVLDGATGLNGKNLVSTESDARWYVYKRQGMFSGGIGIYIKI